MNSHYVYAHYDMTGRVFYIGKGQRKRAFRKDNRSECWTKIAEKGGFKVKIWSNNLDEDTAFQMEEDWIRLYGRKDLGTGNLVNQTNGGKNDLGRIIRHSEMTKEKMKASATGYKWGEERRKVHSLKRKGLKLKPCSDERKKKISESHKGRKWPEELKIKNRDSILESLKLAVASRQRRIICNETKQIFESISEAAKKLNIGRRSINNILSGKQLGPTRGFTFKYLDKQ